MFGLESCAANFVIENGWSPVLGKVVVGVCGTDVLVTVGKAGTSSVGVFRFSDGMFVILLRIVFPVASLIPAMGIAITFFILAFGVSAIMVL